MVLADESISGAREGHAGQAVHPCLCEETEGVPAISPGVADAGAGIKDREVAAMLPERVADDESGLSPSDDDGVEGAVAVLHG